MESNGFSSRLITITDPLGLHMRPASQIGMIARECDSDVYACRIDRELPRYSFLLNGKGYVNVRSILTLLPLGISTGDQLEFIATGPRGTEALEKIAHTIAQGGQ
ncbi:MAG: HPr family phosphocarrier protein [Planctomycetes bacterium]|nr:HPr family phosphocarrier protein [Planctomycetota bacterium]